MIERIEIEFPVPVTLPPGWVLALSGLLHGSDVAVHHGPIGVHSVTASYKASTNLLDGTEHCLSLLVDIVCNAYERSHIDRVMWPGGQGWKPNWSAADAAFLGVACGPQAVEIGEEPTFDETVYCISVAEREAYGAENEYHPDHEKYLSERAAERKAKREARPKVLRVEEMDQDPRAYMILFDRVLNPNELKSFLREVRRI